MLYFHALLENIGSVLPKPNNQLTFVGQNIYLYTTYNYRIVQFQIVGDTKYNVVMYKIYHNNL